MHPRKSCSLRNKHVKELISHRNDWHDRLYTLPIYQYDAKFHNSLLEQTKQPKEPRD